MPVLAVAGSARLYSTVCSLRLSPAIDAAPHGLNVCSCSLTALLRQTKWKPCRLVSGFCGRLLISCTEYGVPAPARGTRYRSAAQVRVRSARRVFRALFLAFDAISIFILNLDKRKKERSAFVFVPLCSGRGFVSGTTLYMYSYQVPVVGTAHPGILG